MIECPPDLQVMRILNEFDFGSDQTIHMRVTCQFVSITHIMGNVVRMIAISFDWIFIKLADKVDRHKIFDKFDFSMV